MTAPWFSFYPKNVPTEIEMGTETLQDILLNAEARFGMLAGFSCMGKTLTFSELFRYAKLFSNYCREELHLQKGDRIALMMPNLLQYPVCLFGALLSGLVVLNLNPLDKADSLKDELADSGAKAIVVLENFVTELEKIIKETAIDQVIITSVGEMQPFFKRTLINGYLRYIKKQVPQWHLPGAVRLHETLKRGEAYSFEKVLVTPADMAFFQYTGGTTGRPKGVMLTHGNLVANLLQIDAWTKGILQEGAEVVMTALPLYHIFSLTINCFLFTLLGGLNILIPDPRNIPNLVKEMKKSRYTCFCGVNTLFNSLLHNETFRAMDHSHVKVVIGGGMAVQKAVADEWQKVTGSVVIQGYGLTETSPVVTINPLDAKTFTGSIGLPIPSTFVSIRDEEDNELPLGKIGNLCVKGPQVMHGYFNRDKETAEALKGGWMHTGDGAYMDEQGFIYIVDRLKDMIIVSGFNVYPAEVENLLKTLHGVNEVAVIGIRDPNHGEVVKAFIVKEKGSTLTEAEIIKFCHDKLAAYKCPHQVEFRDSLPKSNVGKILKKDLRSSP